MVRGGIYLMAEGINSEKRRYRKRTQGVKGAKMPRINMAFDLDVYEFIRNKAQRDRVTMTKIVNDAVRDVMDRPEKGSDHGKETF